MSNEIKPTANNFPESH